MYLNLVQIAESFGVSEKVVDDWIRLEGLPHIPDRGRLLFDRTQVAHWAAARGLAAQAGFLAPANPAFAAGWRLEPLLRTGGIRRGVAAGEVTAAFQRIVEALPGTTPPVRQMVAQRLRASGGFTLAPVGGGFALPHPSARVALGRDAGTLSLLLLREPFPSAEPAPDGEPVTRLFFFIAPSPRAHLDLLGRLGRLLTGSPLRERIARGADDETIFRTVAENDALTTLPLNPEAKA